MDLYSRLAVTQLSATDLQDVLSFSCGNHPWCPAIDDHFQGKAYEQQLAGLNTTYVVRQRDPGRIAAMATFADSTVSQPNPNSKKRPAVLCAYFGLSRDLQGQAVDGIKYSVASCDLTFLAAFDERPDPKAAVLYVDTENAKGQSFWRGYGFQFWPPPYAEEGRTYDRMAAKKVDVLAVISSHMEAA